MGLEIFSGVPTESITVDLHWVTRWSKLVTHREGVSVDRLFVDIWP